MAIRVPKATNTYIHWSSTGPSLSTFSLSAWVKLETLFGLTDVYQIVCGRGTPGSSVGLTCCVVNSKWNLGDLYNDNQATVGPVAGRWYHLGWTRANNQDDRLYVDGTLVIGPVNLNEASVNQRVGIGHDPYGCLLYTSPSPRD